MSLSNLQTRKVIKMTTTEVDSIVFSATVLKIGVDSLVYWILLRALKFIMNRLID